MPLSMRTSRRSTSSQDWILASDADLAAAKITSNEMVGLFYIAPLVVGGCIQATSFLSCSSIPVINITEIGINMTSAPQ